MKRLTALFLTLVMVLSLAACGGKKEEAPAATPDAPSTDAPADAPADEGIDLGVDEIKIGFCGALTGPSANMGEAIVQGVTMAIEEINAAGGIAGVPLKFVTRDDEADATKNLTGVEELLYKEEVDWLLGAPNSGACGASLDIVSEEEVPEVIVTATSAALIDEEAYPYTFRTTSTNFLQAGGLVLSAKEGGYKKIVAVGDTTDLGKDGFNSTKHYAEEMGVEIVDYISYVANDADLSAVAQAVANAEADCIIAWTLAADAAKVVKALERIDYLDKVTILGYSGLNQPKFHEMVDGADCSKVTYIGAQAGFVLEEGQEKMADTYQEFYDKVSEKYGAYKADGSGRVTVTSDMMRAYDSIYMLKWLVEEKTQSLDGAALKEAMETSISEYDSFWSNYTYAFSADNHEGFALEDHVICKMDTPLVNDYVFGDIPWAA